MNADLNRSQRRTRRRTCGGANWRCVSSSEDYAGFDRFGRVIDHLWYAYAASTDRDRYTYGYDRASNRLYRENTLTIGRDELYGYDQVNRLIAFQRGELNATKDGITGTPVKAEEWGLDATGNWNAFQQKTSGAIDLNQSRDHNPVNEITAITASTGTDWADPEHDRAGNMTTIPKPAALADGLTATYDAWNRLVEVKDGETVIGRYEYDGLNRRIKSHIDSGAPSNPSGIDTYIHYYYNSSWQILETRQSDTPSAEPETLQPKHQYVWSQRYIDAAVLRDENTGANGLCDDQRLYYLNDANFNVTALLDTSGAAVERFVYSPYGVVTIYEATWTNTRSTSSYANVTLYTGRELDPETGLYYYRNRYYSADLGRFVSRDPAGYDGRDINLSRYCANMPTIATDPTGRLLKLKPILGPPKPIPVKPKPPILTKPKPPFPFPHPGPSYPPMPDAPTCPSPPPPGSPPLPGDGMKPPGDCSQLEHDLLQDKVNQLCKQPPPPVCTGITLLWSCKALEDAATAHDACRQAREEIMNKCFKGGNTGHVHQADMAKFHGDMCWYKYHWWNCGSPVQPLPFEPPFLITAVP